MVGYYANGNFMPAASYAHRVSFVPSAGLALHDVTRNDTGNYSVAITGTGPAGFWLLEQYDLLHVLGTVVTLSRPIAS